MNLRAFWAPFLGWREGRFVQSQSLDVVKPVWAPGDTMIGDMLLICDID